MLLLKSRKRRHFPLRNLPRQASSCLNSPPVPPLSLLTLPSSLGGCRLLVRPASPHPGLRRSFTRQLRISGPRKLSWAHSETPPLSISPRLAIPIPLFLFLIGGRKHCAPLARDSSSHLRGAAYFSQKYPFSCRIFPLRHGSGGRDRPSSSCPLRRGAGPGQSSSPRFIRLASMPTERLSMVLLALGRPWSLPPFLISWNLRPLEHPCDTLP